MATRSQTITGRYDENLAELRELTAAVKTPTTEAQKLRAIGLAALEALGSSAKPTDTIHLSINSGDDGQQNRTYTVTVTHTPAR